MGITELKTKIKKLESAIEKEIKKEIPKGSRIFLKIGRAQIWAEVLGFSLSGQSLKIRNIETDKEYWTELYYVQECHPPSSE